MTPRHRRAQQRQRTAHIKAKLSRWRNHRDEYQRSYKTTLTDRAEIEREHKEKMYRLERRSMFFLLAVFIAVNAWLIYFIIHQGIMISLTLFYPVIVK